MNTHRPPTKLKGSLATKRHSANIFFLPMVIIGGAMGLLAGYGALTLIKEHRAATTESDPPKAVEPNYSPRVPRQLRVPGVSGQQLYSEHNDPAPVNPPQHDPTSIVTIPRPPKTKASDKPIVAPPPKRIAKPPQKTPPTPSGKPSAIVTLALDKAVLRLVAESERASAVLCDVGFSHNLLHKDDTRDGFEVVAENLGEHNKKTIELAAGIVGGGAAIEITVLHHNNNVVCELRPLFSLPSGTIYPFTKSNGTSTANRLSKALDSAHAAQQSLGPMRSQLSQLQSDLQSAQQAMSASGNTPGETAAGRNAATTRAAALGRDVLTLGRRINAAERKSAMEPEIDRDLRLLNQISKYAEGIASVSTVSVRFHWGDATIPATVK